MTATATMNHPQCNAYCRGGRHAQVMGIRPDLAGREAAALAELCAALGVRFVAAEPAPEAPYEPPDRGWDPGDDGPWRIDDDFSDVDPRDYTRWLLIWEEA